MFHMQFLKETLIPTILLGMVFLILIVGSEAFFGDL